MKIPQELSRSLKVNFGMYNLAVLPLLIASPTSDALLHRCQPSSMKKIPKFQRGVALTCMADWQFRTSGVSRTHIGRRFFSRHSTFHASIQKPNCLRGSSFSGINEWLMANVWNCWPGCPEQGGLRRQVKLLLRQGIQRVCLNLKKLHHLPCLRKSIERRCLRANFCDVFWMPVSAARHRNIDVCKKKPEGFLMMAADLRSKQASEADGEAVKKPPRIRQKA